MRATVTLPEFLKLISATGRKGTIIVYMKKRDVAEMLGCSERSIELWKAKYGLPYVRIQRVVRYSKESVLEWMKAREQVAGQQKKGEREDG